jgi:hypothetical protein
MKFLSGRSRDAAGRAPSLHVFIVTYARSGSTLLQKVIAGIPHCHFTGENADALGGLFASWKAAVAARAEAGGEARAGPGDPWRGAHRIDPERYNRRLAQVFVEEVLQPPRDTRILGFKEVRYFDYDNRLAEYLDYIRATFDPVLLVFNRRDPEAVARSAWWKDHPDDIAAAVRAFDAATGAYAAAHPQETLVLAYDIWSRDPEALRGLFGRLGASFDPAAVSRLLSERLDH